MTIRPDTFVWIADLVRRRSAIQLDRGKEYLVESRLMPLARAAGVADVDTFVTQVRSGGDLATQTAVVEALTTNETSWFRDAHPFSALTTHVVPSLLEAAPPGIPPMLRVWSAACSSGQELYSVAMALQDSHPNLRTHLLGTDLSREMVERARAGRYSQLETNRGLPASMLVRHFQRSGPGWEVSPRLRDAATFRVHNLLDPPPAEGPFDVVLLRNVLIYFDLATKRGVLERMRRAVRPGGYLLLGAAETTLGVDDVWERVPVGRGSVYRLPAVPAVQPARGGAA